MPGTPEGSGHVSSDGDTRTLERRVGRVHLRQRLGIESEHGADVFRIGANLFHIENWYSGHKLLRLFLQLTGLYARGVRNSLAIRCQRNRVAISRLPRVFDGYTLLHLSDLHLDMNPDYPEALAAAIAPLEYDLCVITGDFRARTAGPYTAALEGLAAVRPHIRAPVYAILGNHDSVRMVPEIEKLDVRILLNQSAMIEREGAALYLAGIDDPHYFQVENFEKAADDIPSEAVAVLLSHSPEPYRRAAHIGFDLMLSGHTHGGQICLPGGVPLLTNANCPRGFCAGAWAYRGMHGYTSVGSGSSLVDVRFNCPPEVTLHELCAAPVTTAGDADPAGAAAAR